MKKNIIIWSTALILVFVAAYTMFGNTSGNSGQPSGSSKSSETPKASVPEKPPEQEKTGEVREPGASVANPAKDFTLKDLDGNSVRLSDLKGKKVFLNFWATWCPPCRSEMPDIEKLYKETKNSEVIIIAVNIGEDEKTVKSFIDKSGYTFKVLLDTGAEAANLYNIRAIPASYFINSDGSISNQHVGAMSYDQMKEYLNEMK